MSTTDFAPARLGKVVLGEGKTKVFVPLVAPTKEAAITEAEAYAKRDIDVVEWRIDSFDLAPEISACSNMAASLTARVGHPLLATFRSSHEGGSRDIDPEAYATLLGSLAFSGSVAGIDIEISQPTAIAEKILKATRKAGVCSIGSHHNFEATPSATTIVDQLREAESLGCEVAKFACMPHSPRDVAVLLEATAIAREELHIPIITMAMGQVGTLSRIAGGIFGSAATFATVGPASAPGQLPVTELLPVLEKVESWSK